MADQYLLESSGSYLLEDGSGSYLLETSTNGYLTGSRSSWIGGEATVLAPGTSAFLNSKTPGSTDFGWLYADGTGASLS